MCGCGKVRVPRFLQQKKVMMQRQRQQPKPQQQQPPSQPQQQKPKPKHRQNPRQIAIRRMIQARNRMRNKRR